MISLHCKFPSVVLTAGSLLSVVAHVYQQVALNTTASRCKGSLTALKVTPLLVSLPFMLMDKRLSTLCKKKKKEGEGETEEVLLKLAAIFLGLKNVFTQLAVGWI